MPLQCLRLLQRRYTAVSQVGAGKYMAPEVASGSAYDGKAADVWSCAVILYTLLCGSLPFADSEGVQVMV